MVYIRVVLQILFAMIFIAAGVLHFCVPDFFAKIIPDYLPWHLALVYISGICEILLGVLLLLSRTTRPAAWGLIALLIAVFPANIHMAIHPEQYPLLPPLGWYIRLPIQGILILWAYWYTRELSSTPSGR